MSKRSFPREHDKWRWVRRSGEASLLVRRRRDGGCCAAGDEGAVLKTSSVPGAIDDCLVGECELAMYFLAILNSNDEYKQWGKLNARQDDTLSLDDKEKSLAGSHMNKRRKQYPTDHTQIPLSSAYNQPSHLGSSSKRMIVLNKMDLADRSQTQKWMRHFQQQNCICYGVNSHNKDNIKEFLKFIQAQIRELKVGQSNYTATVLLIGIPNVGKSAIANSLHQIGRISAAEKGKLKHAIVSPLPGGTKDISSFKIASHPNIYVLDTPGVLAPEVLDVEMGSKLALTGAIDDFLVGECELAMYFLAILNSNDEYKQWGKLNARQDDTLSLDDKEKSLAGSHMNKRRKQYPTDHTQDFIVRDVRRMLFSTISSFKGNLEDPKDMERLIKNQFLALHEAFKVPLEPGEDGNRTVATKLLNLYRTGRLGHYTLDYVS